jgi:hypothetical protein
MVIATVADLLGYVTKVEADAAAHFDDLAKALSTSHADEIARLFGQLADQSRKQAEEARGKAAGADADKEVPDDYVWPHYATRLDALKAALQGERRCYEFYVAAEATAKSPEVAKAARPFIKAEGERVKVLEAWITREEWAARH